VLDRHDILVGKHPEGFAMITLEDYVGPHAGSQDWTQARIDNAVDLLAHVNALKENLEAKDVNFRTNPATGSCVSGKTFGGFRPKSCPQGAPNSSHKEGMGVDLYDPLNEIDGAIDNDLLADFGLYREAPTSTNQWCHLTTRAPHSGNRTFQP
jgi:hypothetical protein